LSHFVVFLKMNGPPACLSRRPVAASSPLNRASNYRAGIKNFSGFVRLANCKLDKITVPDIAAFVRTSCDAGLQVTSVNRQLDVLRQIFKLAEEWNETEKRLSQAQTVLAAMERERHRAGTKLATVPILTA
jgi:site-specific recombinase XerD